MDMHGFTLVSDISDDHIRGQYEGGYGRAKGFGFINFISPALSLIHI